MSWYVLSKNAFDDAIRFQKPKDYPDQFYTFGKEVEVPEKLLPLKIERHTYCDPYIEAQHKKYEMKDFFQQTYGFIVSSKLRQRLDELKVNNIQYLPVTLYEREQELSSTYSIANIIGTEQFIDQENSIGDRNRFCEEFWTRLSFMKQIDNFNSSLKLFRPYSFKHITIAHESLVSELSDFTGLCFTSIDDFNADKGQWW